MFQETFCCELKAKYWYSTNFNYKSFNTVTSVQASLGFVIFFRMDDWWWVGNSASQKLKGECEENFNFILTVFHLVNVDRGSEQRLVVVIVSFLMSRSRSWSWHSSSDKFYRSHCLHCQLKYRCFRKHPLFRKFAVSILPGYFVVKLVEDWSVLALGK